MVGTSPEFSAVQQLKGRPRVMCRGPGPAPALGATVPEMFWMSALSMAMHTILSTSETTSPQNYMPLIYTLIPQFCASTFHILLLLFACSSTSLSTPSLEQSVSSQTISFSAFTFFSIKFWSITLTPFSPTPSPFIALSFYHMCSVKFKLN